MENNPNFSYFEEHYDTIQKLQKEDKFFESINLIEEIGNLKQCNFNIFNHKIYYF